MSSVQRSFTHPPDTYAYVNSLRIGRLSLNTDPVPFFLASIKEKEELVQQMIYRITFEMSRPVDGVQRFYSDLGYLGKHYLIYQVDYPNKKRQYTICNCMEK